MPTQPLILSERLVQRLPRYKSSFKNIVIVGSISVVLATGIRLAIGAFLSREIIPYATYFPAVLIATVLAGPICGLAVTLIGGAVALVIIVGFVLNPATITSFILYLFCCVLIVGVSGLYRRAVYAVEAEREKVEVLAHELQHRIKNIGAILQMVVRRTLGADNPLTYTLMTRITGLTALDRMDVVNGPPEHISQVITAELAAFDLNRIDRHGEDALLPTTTALIVKLALHELATNAIKYGALSNIDGRVRLAWRFSQTGLHLAWEELNGPPVTTPAKLGLGTNILKQVFGNAGGEIKIGYPAQGITVTMTIPAQA